MSTLARDVDAYQRALAAYQRKVGSYNRGVTQYNASIMRDPSGNPYVYGGAYDPLGSASGQFYTADQTTGNLSSVAAPTGYAGMTGIPENPGYSMVRQNPTGKQTKILTGVIKGGGGVDEEGKRQPEYFYVAGEPDYEGNPTQKIIDASKVRVVDQKEGIDQGENGKSPTLYTIEYDENSFLEKPGEWTKTFDKKVPDPTKAQVAQAGRPSLAQQELGLIGQVIRGSGLKSGSKGLVRSNMAKTEAEVAAEAEAKAAVAAGGKPGANTPVMVR